ncbi:MAG: HAMP domain-containing histidine kinase [Myxococcaceae bacterium]|nr:HAMP domain-containing histidine kinase [Myxococcaceae bacterium]
MFWRVYLHGLFLLFAVVVAIAVIGFVVGRGNNMWSLAIDTQRRLAEGGPALLGDMARIDAVLQEAGERANANITLYAADNRILGTNVVPPLEPLPPNSVASLGREIATIGRRHWTLVMPIHQQNKLAAYAVAEWRGPGARELGRGAFYLGGILVVLALASAPLVRTILGPLERLTRAVRAFGHGDLTVRSGIRRSDEVGELARAFDEMADGLERLVRNERELLANVSHELRTPLSRIRVALELAAEGDAARAQNYLKEIGSDLAELERLIEDVLTTARLQANGKAGETALPMHPRPVPASELIDASARKFRDAWPNRPLEVVSPAELPVIDADPVLLRRVIDNLLDNARKYSEDGRPIVLRASVEGPDLCIAVSDEGIGLSADDLKQLFTPFFRSDRSRQRGTGGVGLGLAMAKRIVEAHGGTLGATSDVGKGSTFTVTLPVMRVG